MRKRGVVRKYRPDFLVHLANGEMLILETKGQDTEQDQVKRHYLNEWTDGVNAHGGFERLAAMTPVAMTGHQLDCVRQRGR